MRPRVPCKLCLTSVLALIAVFANAPSATAGRLLYATIEHDGHVVANLTYDDACADTATVWRYLGEPPIMTSKCPTNPDIDPANPLVSQLVGDVRIQIGDVNRVLAQVQLSHLTLQRLDAQTQAWHLPVIEVERTAAAAGLGPPSPPASVHMRAFAVLALGGLALAITVGLTITLVFVGARRRQATRQKPSH